MKKAAWIRIAITVEGDADPASDFSKTAVEAVRASAKLTVPDQYKNLKLTITKVYEDTDAPDSGGDTVAASRTSATLPQPSQAPAASSSTQRTSGAAPIRAQSSRDATPKARGARNKGKTKKG